jgi:hypothetical protein
MATLSVKASIAQLGTPDFSLTKTQLKAWEVVRFDVGQGGTTPAVTAAPIGGCYYVKDCTVDVPVAVTFRIASELRDNIDNAIANGAPKATVNAHRQILARIQSHAHSHYSRVATKVIPAWESDIKKDLNRTLPTSVAPTSEQGSDIQARVARLVDYWVRELGYRTAYDVHEWEELDYPVIKKDMEGLHVWLAEAFPIPPLALGPVTRPTITFPPCRPRKK